MGHRVDGKWFIASTLDGSSFHLTILWIKIEGLPSIENFFSKITFLSLYSLLIFDIDRLFFSYENTYQKYYAFLI